MALCDEEVHPIWCNYFIKTNFSGHSDFWQATTSFSATPYIIPDYNLIFSYGYTLSHHCLPTISALFYRPYKFNGCLLYL